MVCPLKQRDGVAKGTVSKSKSILEYALEAAAMGFKIFPLAPNTKDQPIFKGFTERATTDEKIIRAWFAENPDYNYGISTQNLVAVDVDNKNGKSGRDELRKLELMGFDLPETYMQLTPNDGFHFVFVTPEPVSGGTSILAPGLDIRAHGQYIVGRGSKISGSEYTGQGNLIAEVPHWVLDKCKRPKKKELESDALIARSEESIKQSEIRAKEFLFMLPTITAGDRNHKGYIVACKLRDFGLDQARVLHLMQDDWKCEPALETDELEHVIRSAFQYSQNSFGIDTPEKEFKPVVDDSKLSPIERMNKEYAFIMIGGGHFILHETTGPDGKFHVDYLNEQTFHKKFAPENLSFGDKTTPLSMAWLRSPKRREYKGLCFKPGLPTPEGWYNLWRGFSVEPLAKGDRPTPIAQKSLDQFLEHARDNVCKGDAKLFEWLMAYFGHLIQKPWEKPGTCLVFRGGKGVGKNALVERVGSLLGPHFILTDDGRYLTSNFNGHLENLLMLAFDEAFWSGDKQAEGRLKGLITGTFHNIERKGREPYKVENCIRTIVIGNEDWLIPASADERRFAVFDVGDGKKQNIEFFKSMREGMEAGGYQLLLRYLLDVDLSRIDVSRAPTTQALFDQKISSLDLFYQYWWNCLTDGRIIGSEFNGAWPEEINKESFRNSFMTYAKKRNSRGRLPEDTRIGKMLFACCPSADTSRRSKSPRAYKLPGLLEARLDWESFIGHKIEWH